MSSAAAEVMPLDNPPARIMERCAALRALSESPNFYVRTYLSATFRKAADLIGEWMRQAGMTVTMDAIGNIVGRYEGTDRQAPALLIGSHIDTVRDAGSYDGILGVVTGIECVAALHAGARRLPFPIEVYAFGDEEGVRFSTGFLGSRAVAEGIVELAEDATDDDGVTFGDALREFGLEYGRVSDAQRAPAELLAYLELHIEQGPVLESENLSVGTVTTIVGHSRMRVRVTGVAGHAGTVPMHLRNDALVAAAEMVRAVESVARSGDNMVGTVGILETLPGAINVIPGEVRFSVDIRSASDADREAAVREVLARFDAIAEKRGVEVNVDAGTAAASAHCDNHLMKIIDAACEAETRRAFRLPSGAGHDAASLAAICPAGMVFVRCKDGISHNPAESITQDDAGAGYRVLLSCIERLAKR